jgi:hypothetical protein
MLTLEHLLEAIDTEYVTDEWGRVWKCRTWGFELRNRFEVESPFINWRLELVQPTPDGLERKKLVMNADGALDKKLEAYKVVNAKYAEAIKNYQGAWVPSVIMGNSAGTGANGGQALIDMLTAKTAKDLALDMSIVGKK